MSNEIQIESSIKMTNGNLVIPKFGGSRSINQNNIGGGIPGQMTAVIAGVDVITTGITTLGWCRLQNLDSTNFVEWGPKTGGTFYPLGRMAPGEPAGPFRLSPGKTLHLKADTADCKVQVILLEN